MLQKYPRVKLILILTYFCYFPKTVYISFQRNKNRLDGLKSSLFEKKPKRKEKFKNLINCQLI